MAGALCVAGSRSPTECEPFPAGWTALRPGRMLYPLGHGSSACGAQPSGNADQNGAARGHIDLAAPGAHLRSAAAGRYRRPRACPKEHVGRGREAAG